MRDIVHREIAATESDELLTTGEAAILLGSSRQHVVDLCNKGLLPYVVIGKHRRVRRRDLELARTRTATLSRDQRRSVWLNMAVAGKIVAEPEASMQAAEANLARLRAQHPHGQAALWLERWAELFEGPVERVLETLTSPTQYAQEMRQNSPFAGVLEEEERLRVLAAFRDYDRRHAQSRTRSSP